MVRTHPWSPFRDGAFNAVLHHPRTAVVIGRLLGAAILVCFATGLYSHYLQEPSSWMRFPTSPVWLYRVSQGLHVATGIAAIPLLLAKLWTVYPKLFQWPPLRSIGHALERLSIGVLIAATILQLSMGLMNTAQWYPWPFYFRETHFALAFVIVGALLIHIAAKLPSIVEHWRAAREPLPLPDGTGWSRRGFFAATGVAVLAVTVPTVGQTFTPLRQLDVLAPRKPGEGPQGLLVNRTAAEAGVLQTARSRDWVLEVVGPRPYTLTLEQLNAMPQHTVELPIACVEGWSQDARWTGVRIRDLMDRVGAPSDAALHIASLDYFGPYGSSQMGPEFARDSRTLLALRLFGEELDIEHGYPARIISPARPGVLQTKWVRRLEVRS